MNTQIINVLKTYATVAASAESEIIGSEYWAQIPADKVLVVEEFAIFGDSVLQSRFLAGQNELLPRVNGMGTTVNKDYVMKLNTPIAPGTRLNIVVRNTHASTAYAPTMWLKGTLFDMDELVE